jgi:uncharacterized protein YaaQ
MDGKKARYTVKMIMAVIQKNSGEAVLDGLVNAGYTATYSETRGGMLRQSQLSLFIGVKEEDVHEVLEIIKSKCKTRSHIRSDEGIQRFKGNTEQAFELGGAVIFIWKLDQFELF